MCDNVAMPSFMHTAVGALAWTLMIVTVLVEIPVAVAWEQPPYDPVDLTVSDLGATTCTTLAYPSGPVAVCSPLHPLMNTVTALGGALLGVGGVLLRGLAPKGARRSIFVGLLAVSALSWVGAAVVSVDVDLGLHALVALPAFLTQAVALLLVRRDPGPWSGWRRAARWVGLFALGATLLTVMVQALDLPLGLIERLALYPPVLWFAVTGALLLVEMRRAESR